MPSTGLCHGPRPPSPSTSWVGRHANRAMLGLGGSAQFTFLPLRRDRPKRTWMEIVVINLYKCNLSKDLAGIDQNREV